MCLLIRVRSRHEFCKPRFVRVLTYHRTMCMGSLTGIVIGMDSPMRARTCIFLVSASRSEKPMLLRQLGEEAAMVRFNGEEASRGFTCIASLAEASG